MALTLAQLLGTPATADEFSLDGAVEIGKKSTAGSSAIAAGRVVFHSGGSPGTGLWAIATSGSTGRMGVVPNLAPLNVDADSTLQVATRVGAQYYVEANGTIKPGSQVIPDTGGKVKVTTGGAGFAIYDGHYGEGSGLGNAPTDAVAGEAVRIKLTGTVV
jgi:hypothetical protein